jgi:hypothetical protein
MIRVSDRGVRVWRLSQFGQIKVGSRTDHPVEIHPSNIWKGARDFHPHYGQTHPELRNKAQGEHDSSQQKKNGKPSVSGPQIQTEH